MLPRSATITPLAAVILLGAGAMAWAQAPLADAVMRQDAETERALMNRHADVNAAQPDGTTALHWAAHFEDVGTAQALIRAGADVNAVNRYGLAPLHEACMNGNAVVVKALLDKGADSNLPFTNGQTPLMLAARTGHADAVKLLLDRGADVNAKEKTMGETALMWAAAEKHPAVVALLIESRADVNAHSAVFPHSPPAALRISTTEPPGGSTALLFAARQNDLESARLLIKGGAGLNEHALDGTTPLLDAVLNGHFALAKFLLDQGADPNLADDKGRRPLYAAVDLRNLEWSTHPAPEREAMDSLEIISQLLAHGADPNARLTKKIPLRGQPAFDGRWANMAGATAFLRAAQSDDLPVMRMLLANKADGRIQTLDHTTGLMLAAGVGWSDGISVGANSDAAEAMKICLDLGDDVNAVNDLGFVALHGAAYRGADDAVRLLAQHGAKLDVKSKDGRTPLNLAEGARFGAGSYTVREETAALLRQFAAQGSQAK